MEEKKDIPSIKPKAHNILINALKVLLNVNPQEKTQSGLMVDFSTLIAATNQYKQYVENLVAWKDDDPGVNKLYTTILAMDEQLTDTAKLVEKQISEIVSMYDFEQEPKKEA